MSVRRFANALCLLLSVTVPGVSLARAQAGGQPPLAAIRAACADDAHRLCAGVQPGGGRIVACLKDHTDSLSDRCKQAAGLAKYRVKVTPEGTAVSTVAVLDSQGKPEGGEAGKRIISLLLDDLK